MEEVTLQQYSKSLQRVAVLRLLQQLSHVYSVMKISALADLVPFMSFGEVEQIIVDAVKHDFLQVSTHSCTHAHANRPGAAIATCMPQPNLLLLMGARGT